MILNHKDAIAARQSLEEPLPRLTLIVNADLETKRLQEDAGRLQREVTYLTQTIRLQRQDLNAQINQRDLKAAALETIVRALARRLA